MLFEETRFFVSGKETSDDDLLISIPVAYKHLFKGHHFNDRHELSMALMHASCAAEARYYKRPWKEEEYELDLMRVLLKGKDGDQG